MTSILRQTRASFSGGGVAFDKEFSVVIPDKYEPVRMFEIRKDSQVADGIIIEAKRKDDSVLARWKGPAVQAHGMIPTLQEFEDTFFVK